MPVDALDLNRRNWDARARAHGQDRFYDSESLVAGASSLTEVEAEAVRRAVGEVAGLEVIHLQCHIGFDSISLARAGAHVTGLDFSPASLAKAAALAERCGVALSLVEADVCHPPSKLFGQFDLAYATIGVLCWIGDIDAWMTAVHHLLRPGGSLVLVEIHPLPGMIDTTDPLELDFPYCFDGPHVFDVPGSYADPAAKIQATKTVQYAHSIGEVVTAAIDAGLVVRRLVEHPDAPRDYRGDLAGPEADGKYRLRLGGEAIPMLYTLLADRPA
ncbi:MAG: class I SAM-dependent methyltransferase [Candidatus Dormibacteria bacterium]